MPHILTSLTLLLACLILALLLHALWARAVKAVIDAAWPLSGHAHEACGYERLVYHTAQREPRGVVLVVMASGGLAWMALFTGWSIIWLAAIAAWLWAVCFDIKTWQRVAATSDALWFQLGVGNPVDRLYIDDIRDLTVDEEEGEGWTLRSLVPGRRSLLCRLRVRMDDKRVVTLPHSDAARSLDAVEAVANHVRLRKQQAADRQAMHKAERTPDDLVKTVRDGRAKPELRQPASELDRELAAELERLRSRSLEPEFPAPFKVPPPPR